MAKPRPQHHPTISSCIMVRTRTITITITIVMSSNQISFWEYYDDDGTINFFLSFVWLQLDDSYSLQQWSMQRFGQSQSQQSEETQCLCPNFQFQWRAPPLTIGRLCSRPDLALPNKWSVCSNHSTRWLEAEGKRGSKNKNSDLTYYTKAPATSPTTAPTATAAAATIATPPLSCSWRCQIHNWSSNYSWFEIGHFDRRTKSVSIWWQ